MFLIDINSILESISEFVNTCLAFLGSDITPDSIKQWATDFCIQLIATIILFLLIRFFLWKPITNMLEKKQQTADKALEDAKKAKEDSEALKLELEEKLADAQTEVKVLLQNAELDANLRKEEIIKEAKEEAKRRLDEATNDINLEVANKQSEIKELIVNTAFLAASKILEKEVDKEKYLKLVNEIIEGALK